MNDLVDISDTIVDAGHFLYTHAKDIVGNTEGLSEVHITIDIPVLGLPSLDVSKSYELFNRPE